jgi:peptide/nickel transport system permease protein
MLMYSLRRVLAAIPVLLAASVFTFLLVELSPADPLDDIIFQIPPPDPETIQAFRERLYQDRPMWERYWMWLTGFGNHNEDIGLLRGRFGPSVQEAMHIGTEISQRAIISLRLVFGATLIGAALGIFAGVVSALKQYSKVDNAFTAFGFLFLAMPIFWVAALVRETGVRVNDLVGYRFFATFGATSHNYSQMNFFEKVQDVVAHLTLPTVAIVLSGYAIFHRYQRASMLEVLNSDYVRLAKAKGLRHRVVMRRHALRNALIPVTVILTPAIITAVGGAVITETIFRWRGMGTYLVTAIGNSDVFAVMAVVLFLGIFVIIGNLLADLMLAVLDPRIRYE